MSQSEFWNNILLAVETEPRQVTLISGASGYSHPVVALGVDEKRRRVVLISGESDARSAALAQGDIQAAMPSVKVVMARPLAINLRSVADYVFEFVGGMRIGNRELKSLSENKEEKIERFKLAETKVKNFIASQPLEAANLNFIGILKDAVQQLQFIDFDFNNLTKDGNQPFVNFERLSTFDPAATDRGMGVCAIPLYEFAEEIVEKLKTKVDIEQSRDLLRQYDIFQYFFPAADQLALGLVDHGNKSIENLMQVLRKTPEEGHPFGRLEIVDQHLKLKDLITSLQGNGLLVEGEFGLEVTQTGKSLRQKVIFRPREGVVDKISRIFSMKLDISLKDFFK